jgi:hypothetical protein
VLPGGPTRDSDGDSACSRETANPEAELVRCSLVLGLVLALPLVLNRPPAH